MRACHRTGCDGVIVGGACDTCGVIPPGPARFDGAARIDGEARLDGDARSGGDARSHGDVGSGRATAAAMSWTAPSAGSAPSRPSRGSGRSSGRGLLGRGVVEVPVVPRRDPREAVLTHPEVPEHKRFCSRCGAKVGRGRDGRVEGYCARCGHFFSFSPKLGRGELVGGQYEVLGCLAHGGLGWIYLALDHAVADRWVVLKGLLDSGDSGARAAVVAERRFLAQVEHPSIVRIFNFVEHRDTGYIVMEYVGGTSIRDMIRQRRERDAAARLPLTQAIAYILEILPALGYLHAGGLVYCDFKPDNVIQVEEQLKLIDLGAVRHVDDRDGPVFGTPGYQAPEIGRWPPSPASDLYSVGRALAAMTMPVDFHTVHRDTLPGPAAAPLLAEFGSYHRFLRRATHPDPGRRFASAEEMREQLEGVLREVAAAGDGQPRPGPSVEFTPERRGFGVPGTPDPAEVAAALPVSTVDSADPGAVFLAGLTEADPGALAAVLAEAPVHSVEVQLRLARTRIELGDIAGARKALNTAKIEPGDWRVEWHRGLAALAEHAPHRARQSFEAVYDLVPGETAPKLAIAACAELAGEHDDAACHYRLVWRTDHGFVSAAFGLARTLLTGGRRAEAVEVLESVPETSGRYVPAQLAAIRARIGAGPAGLSGKDIIAAGEALESLELDQVRRAGIAREVLEVALAWVRERANGAQTATSGRVLGRPFGEYELRLGLEDCYLTLARHAGSRLARIALVDRANRIRPTTWF